MTADKIDFWLVLPFLSMALAIAGGLNMLAEQFWYDPPLLWSVIGGLLASAVAIALLSSKVIVPANLTALGLGAVMVYLYIYPSTDFCQNRRIALNYLIERQQKTVDYWQACSSYSAETVDYCFDFKPDYSPEQMAEARQRKTDYIARYCGGLRPQ